MWKVQFSLDNKKELDKSALTWVEMDRRYFIYNTSSLKPGLPYTKDRLRQVDDSPNENQFCVEFDINQTRVDERYNSKKLKIRESSRTRQDDFQLERKLQTKYWSIKVNSSILGMDDVNT